MTLRAVGEWARQKHVETRRAWCKFHISIDPATCEIRAFELTDDSVGDSTMAGPLVAASGGQIKRVFAEGAYDGDPVTEAIRAARPEKSPPKIIAPPRKDSIPPPDQAHGGSERECHAAEIAKHGRMAWQKRHDYGKRALVETAVSRIKKLNKGTLKGRTFGSQKTEVAIQVAALNRMIQTAKPQMVRIA